MIKPANEAESQASYLDVLAIPSFRFLWFGQIFSQLAVNTLLFVLALGLYKATEANTAVSGLFLAYGIPAVMFGMVAGAAVDRLDRKRVLVYCDLTRAVLVFTLLFISGNIFLVYLIMFVNAVITQFYVPSEAPTIPTLVPERQLVPANSLFSFTYYSSLAIGSVLAGPLVRLLGPKWIFVLLSAFFAIAAFFESKLPSQAEGALGFKTVLGFTLDHIVSRMWKSLGEGLSYVRQSPVLFDSLLLLTGTQIIFMMLGTLGPGFADRVLSIDIRDASLLIVGPAVLGILIGAVWVGNFGSRFDRRDLIKAGIAGAGISLILLAFVLRVRGIAAVAVYFGQNVRLAISFLLFFLLGFANSLLDVPANSIIQEKAQGDMRGRVYGMLTATVGGVGILPVFLGGILADAVGVGKVVFLLGCIILLYGIYRIKYNHT